MFIKARYQGILLGLVICGLPTLASARPVSYPGGWTIMTMNDSDKNSLHVHYTPDTKHSIGALIRYDRDDDFVFAGAQANRLLKRWNKPDSQANLYAKAALGSVFDDAKDGPLKRDDDLAAYISLAADWETRRYFISGSADYWNNGRFGDYSAFHGRIGIAPYVANTGALHTWFMLEGHNRPESNDKTGVTALVRFFKGPGLLELGVDDQGEPMINYIHRF